MKNDFNFLKVIEKNRKRKNVYYKISFTNILYYLYKYKVTEIAKLLKVSHCSVIYYLKVFDNYTIYNDFIEIYQNSLKLINNELDTNLSIENNKFKNYRDKNTKEKVLYILKRFKKARINNNYFLKKFCELEIITTNNKFNYKNFYNKFDNIEDAEQLLNYKKELLNQI